MTEPNTPPADGAQEPEAPTGIAAALARARDILDADGTLADAGEEHEEPAEIDESGEAGADAEGEGDGDEPPAADESGAEAHEVEDEDDEPEEEPDEPEEEVEAGTPEGDEEEGAEEEPEGFTALIPGRGPDDDDIEIEVSDAATAERLNQLRNGYMNGEAYRTGLAEIEGAQEELLQIEEQFSVDPAGFVLEHLDEGHLPEVALGLLIQPGAWKELKATVDKLLSDPSELRTLQAEAKAARFETKDALQKSRAARKSQTESAVKLRDAIDRMVPEEMTESKRNRVIQDMTRDVADHITRNKLSTLEVKDLPTVLADRLELNGIDPLEARAAAKNGKRNRSKPSTKKKSKGKPKTGKQLAKASAKRKKVAAAPGAGRGAPPVEPKKLPAGQTIQERLAEVRKRGLGSILGPR